MFAINIKNLIDNWIFQKKNRPKSLKVQIGFIEQSYSCTVDSTTVYYMYMYS